MSRTQRGTQRSRRAYSKRFYRIAQTRGGVSFAHVSAITPPLFHCPNCRATYEIVRIEAPPGPTTDCEITCVSCSGPLYGREAKFVLKYFLIERGPSRNLKALTARRFPPPWFAEGLFGYFH